MTCKESGMSKGKRRNGSKEDTYPTSTENQSYKQIGSSYHTKGRGMRYLAYHLKPSIQYSWDETQEPRY